MRKIVLTMTLIAVAAGVGQAQSPGGQTPAQGRGPDFSSNINLVEVHAVVTDRRGQFVTGLTADDFEIFEDGRRQSTAVFDLVDLPVVARASTAAASPEPDVRANVQRFEGRVFVVVLDDLHTTVFRTPVVRGAARRFVERHLGPQDLAAIVYTSGRQDAAQELTANRQLLLESIDKFLGKKLPSASAEKLAVHQRARETESGVSETDDTTQSSSRAANERVDDPLDGERGFNARRALEMVRDVSRWMADLGGRRKALVLLSEGIDYDIYDVFNNRAASSLMFDAREAISAAQRANVSVYAIDPRGLTDMGDESIAIASLSDDASVDYGTSRGFQRELLLAQESLMSLAEETGGMAIVRANDIAGGLERIVGDVSRYYALGYVTDPSRNPGRFRKIEVRLKNPEWRVRARRGYMPPDAKAIAKKREAEVKAGTSPALAAALNNPLPVGHVPARVWAAPFKGSGKNASVLLAVEIDASAFKYDQRDGRFHEDVELSIVAADYTGKVRGTDRQTLNLKLKPETRQALSSGGVRMLSRLELPPSRYQIRIGVHESVGGTVGTVPYDLDVPDYSKPAFAMSGLAITSSGAAALMTPKPDETVASMFPTPPVATRRFARDELVAVYAEIYDRTTPLAHDVELTTTLRSAVDGRTLFSSRDRRPVDPSGQARTVGYRTEIPLRDLPAGSYVLRVEAQSHAAASAVLREVPIEVVEQKLPTF